MSKLGKFLSYVLRHNPDEIGITLDSAGWVSVDELLAALAQHGRATERERLEREVAEDDKQRFALSEDGTRIRANQGHSIPVDLGLDPIEPPELLYQGTVARFLDSIREKGLLRGERHDVHLSEDLETATAVGRRRGAPVILTVRAHEMWSDGYLFYCTANQVWLTEHVPPQYIEFP